MKYLLDTHIIFWAVCNEDRLPAKILNIINSQENDIYFSSASVWEVVMKHRKNPKNMPVDGQIFLDACLKASFIPLPIENAHVLAVDELQKSTEKIHNDPFDRILIAQAKTENMIFITHDSLLTGYDEKCIMKI